MSEPTKSPNSKQAGSKEPQIGDFEGLRPSEFMRARRPALFSDSSVATEPRLSQAVFEYHLVTLTNRKQETEFEHFCRRLIEKEICPNLVPQTGPTGGGDSKVDAETYPVSDSIAQRWFEGVGLEASQQRLAFAFSAKKVWCPKMRSDVAAIAATNRGYALIYFVTNQFVSDKTRANVEAELTAKHGLTVRLLDRGWITKCVFENGRLRLAAETLRIPGFDETCSVVRGPRDVEREAELTELEGQIQDATRYRGVQHQLAEDCLQAALLARGLERPRSEVDGRFERAARISEKVGDRQQRLRIAYARAWTAYWWHDDFEELCRLYDQVEEFAAKSMQATDLLLLSNIWRILHTAVKAGAVHEDRANLEVRTKKLRSELQRLADDRQRPSNALAARTDRLLIDLHEAAASSSNFEATLVELKKALVAGDRLAEFPIEPTLRIVGELGDHIADCPAYDDLFDVVVDITRRRASRGEAGLVLLERGYQKLRSGNKYDAIRMFGQAEHELAMSEHGAQWGSALAGCGLAYESSGLLWAARSNMLFAASLAVSQFWKHGKVLPQTLVYVRRLVWLEMQLGRVFHALSYMELASTLAGALMLDGSRRERFLEERKAQDLTLGLLLLQTDIWELKWLGFLPGILDDLGLEHSRVALLYALGYEDHLRSEGLIPEGMSPENLRDLFAGWLRQPVAQDLPSEPDFMRGQKVFLRTVVLGCEVAIETANAPASVSLAETILAALEAFLATLLDLRTGLFPYRSELRVQVRHSEMLEDLLNIVSSKIPGVHL